MAVRTEPAKAQPKSPETEGTLFDGDSPLSSSSTSPAGIIFLGLQAAPDQSALPSQPPSITEVRYSEFGWPIPSSLCPHPDEARSCIPLPEFDALLLEKAQVISSRFPMAEAEY